MGNFIVYVASTRTIKADDNECEAVRWIVSLNVHVVIDFSFNMKFEM